MFAANADPYKYSLGSTPADWCQVSPNSDTNDNYQTPLLSLHPIVLELEPHDEVIHRSYGDKLRQQFQDLNIQSFGDAVNQQVSTLQKKMANYWDEVPGPYISGTFQKFYINELVRQIDAMKNTDILQSEEKKKVVEAEPSKEVPDLSDYFKTFKQIVNAYGYSMQCHEIETDDGYLLETFRIQPKGTTRFESWFDSPFMYKKPAVLL